MGTDNDKRIAVLVYGMYVEFSTAVKSWKFLSDLNCDVYFSTWNKSKKFSEKLNYLSEYDVTEEMIRESIPNINLLISNENEYSFVSRIEKIKFHWENCLKMIHNSNKKYDILMVFRPENYMSIIDSSKFLTFNEKDRIYGLEKIKINQNGDLFVQDIFFMGDFNIMKEILESLPTDKDDLHGVFAKHVLSKKLQIEAIENFSMMTLRPNCSELPINKINYKNLWEKVKEWG